MLRDLLSLYQINMLDMLIWTSLLNGRASDNAELAAAFQTTEPMIKQFFYLAYLSTGLHLQGTVRHPGNRLLLVNARVEELMSLSVL